MRYTASEEFTSLAHQNIYFSLTPMWIQYQSPMQALFRISSRFCDIYNTFACILCGPDSLFRSARPMLENPVFHFTNACLYRLLPVHCCTLFEAQEATGPALQGIKMNKKINFVESRHLSDVCIQVYLRHQGILAHAEKRYPNRSALLTSAKEYIYA